MTKALHVLSGCGLAHRIDPQEANENAVRVDVRLPASTGAGLAAKPACGQETPQYKGPWRRRDFHACHLCARDGRLR